MAIVRFIRNFRKPTPGCSREKHSPEINISEKRYKTVFLYNTLGPAKMIQLSQSGTLLMIINGQACADPQHCQRLLGAAATSQTPVCLSHPAACNIFISLQNNK
ncbi:MAG: hypothetical protein WHT81_04500 [Rectinemataceae bacterium]|nr:hypothetical protein [Spirochaetaceae bacterium]